MTYNYNQEKYINYINYKYSFSEKNKIKQLEKLFKTSHSTTYFPILNILFKNNFKNGSLDNKFILDKINDNFFDINNYFLNTSIHSGIIRENYYYKYYKKKRKDIFIKRNTILEPMSYMMGYYAYDINNYLIPSKNKQYKINNNIRKKINNIHNSAYLDTFFSYIGSKLVENKECIHFPIYYGSLTTIAKKFYYNISDEIESIYNEPWFIKNNNNIFKIQKKNIFEINKSCSNQNFKNKEFTIENEDENISTFIVNIDDNYNTEYSNNKLDTITNINIANLENIIDNDSDSSENIIDDSNISEIMIDKDSDSNNDNEGSENNNSDNDIEDCDNDSINNSDSDNDSEGCESDNDSINNSDSDNDSINNSDNDNLYNNFNKISYLQDLSDENAEHFFLEMENCPIQMIFMEKLDGTIDKLCNNIFNETEWFSYIFQLCFGLSYVQKKFKFFHNDLHTNNVMYKNTDIEYLYYNINNKYYRIKTFNKIIKIIDFGRSIFTVDNINFFSDVFSFEGEAYGQYTYPYKDFSKKNVPPNPSFDLCYFAITLLEDMKFIEDGKDTELYELLKLWVTDKYNKDMRRYEDFDLYKIIARRAINSIPQEQFSNKFFKNFEIKKNKIPKNTIIYKL